jgi:hypothetical protein
MKMRRIFPLILLGACVSVRAAEPSPLSKKQLARLVTCAAPLVSHWVQEEGFAKEVRTLYAGFEFVRTDVGDSDGRLRVSEGTTPLCDLEISLSPDVYFSARERLMIVLSYSGSGRTGTLYSLKNAKCKMLGSTSDDASYAELMRLLSESDGSRVCKAK